MYFIYEVSKGKSYSIVVTSKSSHTDFPREDGWTYLLLYNSRSESVAYTYYQEVLEVELEGKYEGFINPCSFQR